MKKRNSREQSQELRDVDLGEVRTILVSPHQDDVAMSLGGSILSGIFAKPVMILNVFTLTSYAPYDEGGHDVISVSRARAREDDSFVRHLNLAHFDLGLRDALVRWDLGQDAFPLLNASSLVRGFPTPGSRLAKRLSRPLRKLPVSNKAAFLQKIVGLDRTYAVVKSKISNVVSKCPNATVVAPLSVGSHPDHIIAACACEDVRSRAFDMAFYEDLPYAWRYTMRDISRHVDLINNRLVPRVVDIGLVLNAKIANLRLYRSQLGPREIEAVINHSKRIGRDGVFERLWVLETGGQKREPSSNA